ncbi:hypothetical protein M3G18_02060 [Corynebacterium sp. p3-SID1145]|uniref:hypothetical protein n=1 Tax=unclassified Corynebacterium TaxID=2624378 RepID=UPI0021AA8B45|nr:MULTISPECIES: hypothetical protein [unclassified Corynebacterium]MCT1451701.1 hypothetical protein [Corynebacterium sp. p3-SID1145]MCT1460798.1 hypothetical protein [Corynebacterium sp. p3-SID1140]
MKLNYSLNTGFASGDGTPPTRDNIDSWIAWVPVPSSDLTADTTLGTTFFLTPRAIPQLSEDTVLLGVPVGEAGLDIDASLDPQQLSYTDGADAKVSTSRPVELDAVRVVATKTGPARRKAQSALIDVPGERQFHIIHELFEQ